MKKVLLALTFAMSIVYVKAQVGIGTDSPKATLDVVGANTSTSVDGIIIPRVTRVKAIDMVGNPANTLVENSTLIYVNDVTGYANTDTSVASEVDLTGFYFYKKSASKWKKLPDYDQIIEMVEDNSYWKAQASSSSPKGESESKGEAKAGQSDIVKVDIYQKGKVGIGYSDAYGIDFGKYNTQKQLEVGGDFRTSHYVEDKVNTANSSYFGFETNSVALPQEYAVRGNVMYSAATKDLETYSDFEKKYDGNILIQAKDEVYSLSRTGDLMDTNGASFTEVQQNSKSFIQFLGNSKGIQNQIREQRFLLFNKNIYQIGIDAQFPAPESDVTFGLDFVKGNFFLGNSANRYYFPNTKGTIGQTLRLADSNGNLEWAASTSSNAAPQFFYMPSILLPTNSSGTVGTYVTEANGVFTVDLYAVYKQQFDNPIKSSNGASTGLAGFVLARDKYEYHITYADGNVFPHADIIFSTTAGEEGKLTYKVNPNAIVQNGSFMNIVLKVK